MRRTTSPRRPRDSAWPNRATVPPLPHPSWFGEVDSKQRLEPRDFWAKLGL